MRLNPYQREAVGSLAAVLVIVAGAGTGKTATLIERCRRLVRIFGRVRLVAFTRAAAATLRARIAELPEDLEGLVEVDTLHGFCSGICRRHLHRLDGFEKHGWTVIDGPEAEAVKKQAKAQGTSAATLRRKHGLVSYDELLSYGLQLLRSEYGVHETGGALLVDEAQDLTPLEWQVVGALSPESLTAVADPAQAIYGWRGAMATALASPSEAARALPMLAQAQWLTLPENYRSKQRILDVANRLPIPGRVDLRAHRGPGGHVHVWRAEFDEHHIERLIEAFRRNPGQWAILSRTKARLATAEAMLKAEGIPVRGLLGKTWEAKAARELLDLLRIVESRSALHIDRVLERAGVTRVQRLKLDALMLRRRGKGLWGTLCDAVRPEGPLHGSAAHRVLAVLDRCMAEEGTARSVAAELVAEGVASSAAPVEEIPEDLSIRDFFFWLASPPEASSDDPDEEAVTLATVHGAKGLEWSNVLLLGCEDGHLPMRQRRSCERPPEDHEAEERRIFYVAATRAADTLILASSNRRPGFHPGHFIQSDPSRFLEEAGLSRTRRTA